MDSVNTTMLVYIYSEKIRLESQVSNYISKSIFY